MSEKAPKKSNTERGLRWYRNYNALGTIACAGAAMVVPGAAAAGAFEALAWINGAQTAGSEYLRRRLIKRQQQSKAVGKAALKS